MTKRLEEFRGKVNVYDGKLLVLYMYAMRGSYWAESGYYGRFALGKNNIVLHRFPSGLYKAYGE